MWGNCKFHLDVPMHLKDGERGKTIVYCPKCEEERQTRFEKMFGSRELPDVVKVKIETIPTEEIKENSFHKSELDSEFKHSLELYEVYRKVDNDQI